MHLHLSLHCLWEKMGLLRCCGSKKSILIKLSWKHASRPRSSFVKERCAHIKVCCNDMVKDLLLQENILLYCQVLEMKLSFIVKESFIWSESKNIVGRIRGQVQVYAFKSAMHNDRKCSEVLCHIWKKKASDLFGSFVMNLELQANQTDSNIYCSATIGETLLNYVTVRLC